MNEILILSGYILWALVAFVVLSGMFHLARALIIRYMSLRSLHSVIYTHECEARKLKDALEKTNKYLLNEQADYTKMHRKAQKFESKAAFWQRSYNREKAKHDYFVSVVLEAHDLLPKEVTGDTLDLVGNLKRLMTLHGIKSPDTTTTEQP